MAAGGEQWRHPPLLHFSFLSTSLEKERKGFKTGIAMISAVKIKIAKSTTVTSRSCEVSQLKKTCLKNGAQENCDLAKV